MKITYENFENPNAQLMVEKVLTPFLHLFPGWVRGIWVSSAGSGPTTNTMAAVTPNAIYRTVTLHIYFPFFDATPQDQKRYLLHELIHCHLEEATEFVLKRLLNPLEKDKPEIHELLDNQFHDVVERVVQELAFLMEHFVPKEEN